MAGLLVNALGSAAATAEAFSDVATLRHMLRFEAALAYAAADAGLIPKQHARVIEQACEAELYDPASWPKRRGGRRRLPCRWSRR